MPSLAKAWPNQRGPQPPVRHPAHYGARFDTTNTPNSGAVCPGVPYPAGLPDNVTREAFDEFLVMSREIRQA